MNTSTKIFAALFVAFLLLAGASRAEAFKIYAVDSSNKLLSFDSATSGTIQATTPITGLQSGESIRGIDFRPATRQLYAVGSSNRLYIINTATAAATPVGSPGAFTLRLRFGGGSHSRSQHYRAEHSSQSQRWHACRDGRHPRIRRG